MEENAYESPDSHETATRPESASASITGERLGGCHAVMFGAFAGIVGAFPIAALVAVVYRFPVPFDGLRGGLDAVIPVLFAVLFYGILGGFVVVGVLGALAGAVGHQVSRAAQMTRSRSIYLIFWLALAIDVPPVLLLAVLDKIIGPW